MDLPAYGARNVERVATGTWETLPGPTTPGMGVVGASASLTGDEPGSGDPCRVGVGGGRSTA
jgi:hypothetical protein